MKKQPEIRNNPLTIAREDLEELNATELNLAAGGKAELPEFRAPRTDWQMLPRMHPYSAHCTAG